MASQRLLPAWQTSHGCCWHGMPGRLDKQAQSYMSIAKCIHTSNTLSVSLAVPLPPGGSCLQRPASGPRCCCCC
eukprot:scaffold167734_cov15-Tisochrysis_lutea.AAC.1